MPARSEGEFIDALRRGHPELIEGAEVLRAKRVSVVAKREGVLELARALRDEYGFTHPVSAGAVDYVKEGRMQMIYYLMNPDSRFMLMLRVDLPRDDPRMLSMTQIWEAMSFHEREAWEMFGIDFEGHPNLMHLLLPPDWRGGYPLRKDFKGEGISP
ncbi:MAG: hypothetical protein AYL28_002360 [Candidatus Bathyarchaeota archaeon B23]|nr:MAG: hypothetical protein AYL28_002360 [Candidatus Bathyarchaeota archaeon B23]